jgi:hypothetical protein
VRPFINLPDLLKVNGFTSIPFGLTQRQMAIKMGIVIQLKGKYDF